MNIIDYENYQEKKSHVDTAFPYITYPCSIPLDFNQVPLHWHEEMEIVYIKKGKGLVTIDFKSYPVEKDTILFILPGQLHSIEQLEQYSMEYENIIFKPDILLSPTGDNTTSDFFRPLLDGQIKIPSIFTPDHPCYQEIASYVDGADRICMSYPYGYELGLKAQLFLVFFTLFSKCSRKADKKDKKNSSAEKMRPIIKYVENHYGEKITILDIATEVGLSESHFMKLFKNTMGTSFMEYLRDYRLTIASRLLLSSDDSILIIAEECGFENLSYFNRSFKKRFAMTPREYRKEYL